MRFFNGKFIKSVIGILFFVLFAVTVLFCRYAVEREYIYPLEYKEDVFCFADKFGLDRALVFAVIKTESGFRADAESRVGAVGLMQIKPKTGEFIAKMLSREEYDLKDGKTNVEFGCCYLRYLTDKFKVEETALYAYNAGEGKVFEWLKDERFCTDGMRLNGVPYRETEEYVKKIYKSLRKYRKLYGKLLDKVENIE